MGSRGWASVPAASTAALGGGTGAQVAASGGGLVPGAGLRGKGLRSSPGEGPTPVFCQQGDPPLTSTLQHLPAASDEVPTPRLGVQSPADPALPAALAVPLPPPPLIPVFGCPECPACPRPEPSCCEPGPEIDGLIFLYLGDPGSSFQVGAYLSLLRNSESPPRRVGVPCIYSPGLCPDPVTICGPGSQGAGLLHFRVPNTGWPQGASATEL